MFCGLKKIVKCNNSQLLDGIVESTLTTEIEVRRFGIDQNQTTIINDDFGEPIDLTAQQNYFSFIINAKLEIEEEKNDESSKVGGRVSGNSKMMFHVKFNEDLLLNDLVVYPPYSNQTYRVIFADPRPESRKRIITAINDDKSTK